MSLSLRKSIKASIFLRYLHLLEPEINPQISDLHGFQLLRSSAELCSWGQRRSGRQRRWICRQQMCVCTGISLPMSRSSHYSSHRCLDHSHSEVPCLLPHSLSQSCKSVLQEEVQPLNSRVSNIGLESWEEMKIRVVDRFRKHPFDYFCSSPKASSCNGFSGQCSSLFSHSSLGFIQFVVQRKILPLYCRVYSSRVFSSVSNVEVGLEEEKEEIDYDCNGGHSDGEGESVTSSADPSEVERVCKVIDELFASDRNMEAVLDQCGIDLSHDLVLDVLARYRQARKPAFRFFSWAELKPGFEHDSRTYNAMMGILGKSRQFESMVVMLEEMGNKGLLTVETFAISIRAFAAAREMKKAVGIFELMKKYKFKADVDTFNCLLDALGRAKLGEEAQILFEKLKDRFTPDLRTYTVLLAGWCKLKKLIEAGKVWNEMIDKDLKPDIVAHNIMLEGLLRCRKNSEAIKLFELMKARGPSPNVRSYTILIRDLCKANKMKEAVDYFDEMLESGRKPDAAVYTCLMVGFGNQKKMDVVYGLLKEMKEKDCPPDGRSYNALIKLMTNREMPDDAVRLYKKMIKSGHEPTIHTYNMMMKSYFHTKNYEMGRAVWDEMNKKGCCPDDNSYTVFINGLIRNGRSEEACKYIEEMLEKGMKAPQLDYNKFAADFSRAGKPDILEELAQKMKFSGKFEVSNVFARWSEMMKKRVKRRY